jgi:hypothetical protein
MAVVLPSVSPTDGAENILASCCRFPKLLAGRDYHHNHNIKHPHANTVVQNKQGHTAVQWSCGAIILRVSS